MTAWYSVLSLTVSTGTYSKEGRIAIRTDVFLLNDLGNGFRHVFDGIIISDLLLSRYVFDDLLSNIFSDFLGVGNVLDSGFPLNYAALR